MYTVRVAAVLQLAIFLFFYSAKSVYLTQTEVSKLLGSWKVVNGSQARVTFPYSTYMVISSILSAPAGGTAVKLIIFTMSDVTVNFISPL